MRIAYVSLIPDPGHVAPLVRIASALEPQCECKFYVAAEAEKILASSGLEFELMPEVLPERANFLLGRISVTRPIYRKLFYNRYFESHYYQPIQHNGFKCLPLLSDMLEHYRPDIIVTDEHLLGLAVHLTGHRLGINVLQHRSSGSNQQCQDLQPYARPTLPVQIPLTRILSRAIGKIYNITSRICNPHKFAETQKMKIEVEQQWASIIKKKNELNIPPKIFTTGIAVLEAKHLSQQIKVCEDIDIFGPLPPLFNDSPAPEDADWLNSSLNKPVILVSLGSMVSISQKLARSIVEAGKLNGCRILWISRSNPIPRNYQDDTDIRHVAWAPQPALLADDRIKGFISHAGSGAVQEAFWFGKPLLCIPQLWDQPYNAWVIESLGVGITIDKTDFSTPIISDALGSILHDETIRERMKTFSAEIRFSGTPEKLFNYMETYLSNN